MITDPIFYLAAVPAMLIAGIGKGGFGGALGVASVPLMALVINPVAAAGIMLPVLCVMDIFGLHAYRGVFDGKLARPLIFASLAGIALGWATAAWVSEDAVRVIVGAIAVVFPLYSLTADHITGPRAAPGPVWGLAAGGVSGFTSFVAHAGGPPVTLYLIRQGLDRRVFVGTTVIIFAVLNYAKLVPYAALGQLGTGNLLTAAALSPLAPIGIYLGVYLVKRVRQRPFVRLIYVFIIITGVKLLYDGTTALIAA